MNVLGLVPARGGSKSIPYKNIVPLKGHPLLAYVIRAAQNTASVDRIICSTDDEKIAAVGREYGAEILERPEELARDDTHIIDVMVDVLQSLERKEGYRPDVVALLQPTSPFLLPEHIEASMELLASDPEAGSVQTVASFPHNFHAYNQRVLDGNRVSFRFARERQACYNKQTKPKFYIFGNLVATRRQALLEERQVFAEPSLAHVIPAPYALDVDTAEDLEVARWYLESGRVKLSWR